MRFVEKQIRGHRPLALDSSVFFGRSTAAVVADGFEPGHGRRGRFNTPRPIQDIRAGSARRRRIAPHHRQTSRVVLFPNTNERSQRMTRIVPRACSSVVAACRA